MEDKYIRVCELQSIIPTDCEWIPLEDIQTQTQKEYIETAEIMPIITAVVGIWIIAWILRQVIDFIKES